MFARLKRWWAGEPNAGHVPLRWCGDRSETIGGLAAVVMGSEQNGYFWRICDGRHGREFGRTTDTRKEAVERAETVLRELVERDREEAVR